MAEGWRKECSSTSWKKVVMMKASAKLLSSITKNRTWTYSHGDMYPQFATNATTTHGCGAHVSATLKLIQLCLCSVVYRCSGFVRNAVTLGSLAQAFTNARKTKPSARDCGFHHRTVVFTTESNVTSLMGSIAFQPSSDFSWQSRSDSQQVRLLLAEPE